MKGSRHKIILAPEAAKAWESAVRPWFEQTVAQAWQSAQPSLVITPTRGQANFLRERWLHQGGSHLGLSFVTPGRLQNLLGFEAPRQTPALEHPRLLLAIAAAEIDRAGDPSDVLAAKAVARAPGHLLRALLRLENAGWDFGQLRMPSFQRLINRFHQLLQECDFALPGALERRALQKIGKSAPRFARTLLYGFDGAHWPEWFLLRTAVALTENATVLLEEPRADFSDLDLCWIGSWEEACGAAVPLAHRVAASSDSFFSEAEMRGEKQQTKRFDFLIGLNASEQAEAIVQQCLRDLADEKCTRLGVIFPESGALSRLVASSLAAHSIPHNDGLAHIVPGIFETEEWQAWLALQRAPRLDSFLRFLNAFGDPARLAPQLSRSRLEQILRQSHSEILLDDLALLRAFCAADERQDFQQAAAALRNLPLLPARATMPEFLRRTLAALEYLGWPQHQIEISARGADWADRLDVEFSRALFLRWLEETAATFGAERAEAGNHPYARVQLLTVPHAQNQEWSHLIFAGWNEGAWPPPAGAEFAREEEIRAFNRSIQQLNKRAARQGSQGEGHTSVRENHALYLGPIEQRAIALRQFHALLETASEAVTLTAALVQEDAPERFWNPSECLAQLYFKERREPLTQMALKNLQRATGQWLEAPTRSKPDDEIRQTLIAFRARRDSSKPAGEYDFALRANEDFQPVPTLSVSDLQRMISAPALVWMKRYLGVEAEEDATDLWPATTGKWVHRWLAGIGTRVEATSFARFPAAAEIDRRVGSFANENLRALQELCDSLGKSVPDWWRSGWLNARYFARHLGDKISRAEGWNWMAAELPIGRDGLIKIADEVELQLRGQIDLVLAQNEATDFNGGKFWIVDYKTGSTKELKSTGLHDNLVRGTTLQLGLYALALRALGAAEVGVSIISAGVRNVAPQLQAAELEPHTDVFRDLAEMQRTGVFGMKGEVRPAFGFRTPYPLATLPIDSDLLDDKWALTHPALVLEKEEWENW